MKLVILSGLWFGWVGGWVGVCVCVCDTFGGTREGIILFSEITYDISSLLNQLGSSQEVETKAITWI